MQCKEFEKEWIEKGSEGLSPASFRHLQTCEACRDLIAVMEGLTKELNLASPVRMPDSLKRDILDKAANPNPGIQFVLNIFTILAFIPLILFIILTFWSFIPSALIFIKSTTSFLNTIYLEMAGILLINPIFFVIGMILCTGTIFTVPLLKNRL